MEPSFKIRIRKLVNVLFLVSIFPIFCESQDFITEDGKDVAEATKLFPYRVYHATKQGIKQGNFVMSPFSIGSVLTMLREGSDGLTREEFNEAMFFGGLSDNKISNGYYDIIFSLHENRNALVRISNRIYLANSGKFNPEFTDVLDKKYFTKVLPSNFAKSQEIAEDINSWVESSTEGRIKNLISSGSIEANTKAIVANTIYFKGSWTNPFHVRATSVQLFENEDGNSTKTPSMYQDDIFPYVELGEMRASAISMPYKGDRFSLIVVLPNVGTPLSEVEEKLGSFALSDIPGKMSPKSIQLTFPKFRMENEVDFIKAGILEKIGLKLATTPGRADFSQISKENKFHIDKVIQKCFIDVTEEGTEAAGATYTKIVPLSIRRSIPFQVTRPFFAYIFDSITKSVLFTFRKSSA